ncbi:MAG: ABC transporter ATP-binding protein [Acidobacteriia bacterium]|nr:ABC transporter ATP-binding protein [Terriglobia bacterium]
MKAEDAVVRVENLTVRYGSKTACADISLAIPRGSVYALLGRNAAGKSSLVRCLVGQQKPQSGGAFLFGRQVWSNRTQAMKKVGVVPEEPDAPPEMTAKQLAAFCSRLYLGWDHESFAARLTRFRIPWNDPFKNLSKGQKAMLLFSLALAPHPELLVLDDPTVGLDAVARKATLEDLVGDLADRAPTVLVATHDLQGIEGIADRVGILKEGRLLLNTQLEDLKSRYRKIRYLRKSDRAVTTPCAELESFAAVNVRWSSTGVETVVSDFDENRFERFRCSNEGHEAEASPMSLEEIFVAVAGEETGGAS